MKKKPAKKQTPTPEYDSKRAQNVLLEEMNRSIKNIAGGHSVIVKNQEEIKAELGTVKMAVIENSRDIKVLKADVKELKEDVKELKEGQKEIKQKLDTTAEGHEHRIQKLEAVR